MTPTKENKKRKKKKKFNLKKEIKREGQQILRISIWPIGYGSLL